MVEPIRQYSDSLTGRFKFRQTRRGTMVLVVEVKSRPIRWWPPFGIDTSAKVSFNWRDATWEDVVALGIGDYA